MSSNEKLGNDMPEYDAETTIRIPLSSPSQPLTATAQAEAQAKLSCRMYSAKFPEVDDLVMVNVRQIAEVGAYVQLLEYNNIEGMILLSELSRRRIRSIQKLIRVGRNEVVVVLRVDKEKGYIDLSKRRVSAEDIQKCEEKYNKSKAVHGIMRHVAEKLDLDLEDLYTRIGWPLYSKYVHAIDAFKLAIAEPNKIFEGLDFPSDDTKAELISNIKRRLTPQAIKIRADIECSCYGYEGIDAIKSALQAGQGCSTDEIPIKIRLVAPPLYVMVTHSLDKSLGIATLEKSIIAIESNIKAANGSLIIKMKPRAVSENDDLELAQLMAKVERENAEVSGDEESEGEEDE